MFELTIAAGAGALLGGLFVALMIWIRDRGLAQLHQVTVDRQRAAIEHLEQRVFCIVKENERLREVLKHLWGVEYHSGQEAVSFGAAAGGDR